MDFLRHPAEVIGLLVGLGLGLGLMTALIRMAGLSAGLPPRQVLGLVGRLWVAALAALAALVGARVVIGTPLVSKPGSGAGLPALSPGQIGVLVVAAVVVLGAMWVVRGIVRTMEQGGTLPPAEPPVEDVDEASREC